MVKRNLGIKGKNCEKSLVKNPKEPLVGKEVLRRFSLKEPIQGFLRNWGFQRNH